jgi:hypothetical protein
VAARGGDRHGNWQADAMDIIAFGTPFGLAFASGLNAYLPMLAFALSVRWLHMYKLNPHFAFVTQTWFIAALVILALLDFVADKIPFIDHVWNAIHGLIRPFAGAVVAIVASSHVLPATPIASATDHVASGAAMVPLSVLPITGISLLVILIIGGVLAALGHSTKSTARIVSTLTTAGFLNAVLSLIEDVLVVIIILLSLFAASIMFILLILLLLVLVPRFMRTRNLWKGRRWRL